MGYGIDGLGSIPDMGKRLSLLHSVQSGPESHSPSYAMVKGALLPGLKRQKRETDHSPPSSAEVKNGAILPLPHTSSWRGGQPTKHTDDFPSLYKMKLRPSKLAHAVMLLICILERCPVRIWARKNFVVFFGSRTLSE
jgi:hypothetical protein